MKLVESIIMACIHMRSLAKKLCYIHTIIQSGTLKCILDEWLNKKFSWTKMVISLRKCRRCITLMYNS